MKLPALKTRNLLFRNKGDLHFEEVGAKCGFDREDANALSRHVALPVIAGATLLKGTRLVNRGLPRELRRAFAAGAGASFASTFASTWLIRQVERFALPERPTATAAPESAAPVA